MKEKQEREDKIKQRAIKKQIDEFNNYDSDEEEQNNDPEDFI